jgi:hypothetical protein
MTDLLKNYYKILEIPENASLSDIKRSYLHLKELYTNQSIVTLPLDDEFSAADKNEILNDIENAYHALKDAKSNTKPTAAATPLHHEEPIQTTKIPDINLKEKGVLKLLREKSGMELESLSLITKLSGKVLKNIEEEIFELLPSGGYLRWHIQTYIKNLPIATNQVIEEYMKRYRQWLKIHPE